MADEAAVAIERAMVALRRSWSRRTLQRRAASDQPAGPGATGASGPGPAGRGAVGAGAEAAVFPVLDAIEGATEAGATITVNGVAQALWIDQPRASRLVARAVAEGLVRRGADPDDGRRSILSLTRRGARVLADGHRTRRQAVEAALDGWSAEDRETLARLLSAFVDGWQHAAARPR